MTKKAKNIFSIIIPAIVIVIVIVIVARPAAAAGLVPCGAIDAKGNIVNPCNYCYFLQLIKNVIDFLTYLVFPLATAMIIYGGFTMMFDMGSSERHQKGRQIITKAVTGILIALLAWLVIDTIIKVIAPDFTASSIGPWNQLKCSR